MAAETGQQAAGQAFPRAGVLNRRTPRHAGDPRPRDPEGRCPACTGYSRAYLHHLVKAREMLAGMLLTAHNLHYYQDLMAAIRDAIAANRYAAFAADFAVRESETEDDDDA